MEEIHTLSQQYGFKIIEDAAHAIGAKYQNNPVGNCLYSDITVFSFHPVKIITTGEGGAAMTNSSKLAEKMSLLRTHGITRDPVKMKNKLGGLWYYEQIDLGFNYRMTDIQAALGISQLKRLDQYILRRTEIAKWYDKKFKDVAVTPLMQKSDRSSAYHLYVILVGEGKNKREKLYNYLYEHNIRVNVHYIPIYRQAYYSNSDTLKVADMYYQRTISLPMFTNITTSELNTVVDNTTKHIGLIRQ